MESFKSQRSQKRRREDADTFTRLKEYLLCGIGGRDDMGGQRVEGR